MATEPAPVPRPFRDALYAALAGGGGVRDADPVLLLDETVRAARRAAAQAGALDAWQTELAALEMVAAARDVDGAATTAARVYATGAALREAVFASRSLSRDAEAAKALRAARDYLGAAVLPPGQPELATDRDAVLDAATFAQLWQEPARLDWMLDTVALWKRDYLATYRHGHEGFNAALDRLAEQVENTRGAVAALERLNQLRRLGPAVATGALAAFHGLERLFRCPLDAPALGAALQKAPACPACGFLAGDQAPVAELRRVLRALERGLAVQQARLGRRVVALILARPATREDESVARFLQVVQASDLGGLVNVLDDSLVEFLRRLLESPAGFDVFARVARAYPEVTRDDVDEVVREFRTVLETALSAGGGRLRLAPD